jgi:leucine-rich PPR motif-containing protein
MQKELCFPNVITYTSLITGCTDPDVMHSLYTSMKQRGILPNNITYQILIKNSIKLGKLENVPSYIESMVADNIFPTLDIFQAIVLTSVEKHRPEFAYSTFEMMREYRIEIPTSFYALVGEEFIKRGDLDQARKVLDEMILEQKSDPTFLDLLVNAFGAKDLRSAEEIFEMHSQTCSELSRENYLAILRTCANLGATEKAQEYFSRHNTQFGFHSDAFSFLIQAFVNSHDFVKAEQVLEEMQGKGFEPDAHAYFTLVSAHMRENPDRSLYWVNVMITRSFVKNSEIWERILLQFVEVAKYSYANEVLDYMLKTGIRVQTASLVKLVSGFILCADMDNATRTVNKLAEYDNPLSGFHFNGVLQEFLNLGDNASVGTIVRGLQQLNFSIPNLKEQYNTKHTKIKT